MSIVTGQLVSDLLLGYLNIASRLAVVQAEAKLAGREVGAEELVAITDSNENKRLLFEANRISLNIKKEGTEESESEGIVPGS